MHTLDRFDPRTAANLRILPDGKHLAPAADDDIWGCNERFKIFPHEDFTEELRAIGFFDANGKRSGGYAIDCGAFIGDHTSQFSSWGMRTFAIEPFFDAFACLCYNSPTSSNICGVAGDGRRVKLVHQYPGTNHGMRSVLEDPGGIPTICVDSIAAPLERLDLLKIDVEGCEEWVLDGARTSIMRFHPVMIIESFDQYLRVRGSSRESLQAHLSRLGCRMKVLGNISDPKFDWLCWWE